MPTNKTIHVRRKIFRCSSCLPPSCELPKDDNESCRCTPSFHTSVPPVRKALREISPRSSRQPPSTKTRAFKIPVTGSNFFVSCNRYGKNLLDYSMEFLFEDTDDEHGCGSARSPSQVDLGFRSRALLHNCYLADVLAVVCLFVCADM